MQDLSTAQLIMLAKYVLLCYNIINMIIARRRQSLNGEIQLK